MNGVGVLYVAAVSKEARSKPLPTYSLPLYHQSFLKTKKVIPTPSHKASVHPSVRPTSLLARFTAGKPQSGGEGEILCSLAVQLFGPKTGSALCDDKGGRKMGGLASAGKTVSVAFRATGLTATTESTLDVL